MVNSWNEGSHVKLRFAPLWTPVSLVISFTTWLKVSDFAGLTCESMSVKTCPPDSWSDWIAVLGSETMRSTQGGGVPVLRVERANWPEAAHGTSSKTAMNWITSVRFPSRVEVFR